MAFCSNHERIYFDTLCRTKKAETVLSLIHATYQTKLNKGKFDKSEKEIIAEKLEYAYELFKFDSGTYSGDLSAFESQYTIGHEMGIWQNSDLDLTPLAIKVAEGNLKIKDYFSVVFLNYIQPVKGKIIHILHCLLTYMYKNNLSTITKEQMAEAYESFIPGCAPTESVNSVFNFMVATDYFKQSGRQELVFNSEYDIKEIIDLCDVTYLDETKYTYEQVKEKFKDLKVYLEYLLNEHRVENTDETVAVSDNIFDGFTPWLTSFDNPDYTGKEKYEGYPRALQRLTQFMKEKGYIEDDNLNDKNIEKYNHIKDVYDITDEVKKFDEKYLASKAGIAALKKYIKYIEFLNNGRAPKFSFKTSLNSDKARNRIIFGAPGTGKSYTLNKEKDELLTNGGGCERVTFHPDYSYANFVGTYKPVPCVDKEGDNAITYSYVPGPFMRTYVKALKNSASNNIKPYLLVIEEINRANVAAVFGEVFQLLDRDVNNVSEYPIQASEDIKKFLAKEFKANPEEFEEIRIPDNMFIWATMNSADQGVFPMDTAFKRRWDFSYRGIDEGEEKIKSKYVELGKNEYSRKVEWNELRKAINDELLEYGINEDKLMGPYFISKLPLLDDTTIDAVEFKRIFKNKVLMYLFDDAAKQKRPSLFNGCQKPKLYSAVCNDFDEKGVSIFCERIRDKFLPSSTVNNDEN